MKEYVFKDIEGNVLASYTPLHLPIREEIIIRKSIELFSDEEPCIIHRTYVMKKLMIEINDIVDELFSQNSNFIRIESGVIWNFLEMPKNAGCIEIYY